MNIFKIILIIFFAIALLISGCKKTKKKEIEVKEEVTTKRERTRESNEWCIEWGIIQDTMTLQQCEQAMGQPLEFRVDLHEGWAIYGLDHWNIYTRYGVVKGPLDWALYYIQKSIEYGKKQGILK